MLKATSRFRAASRSGFSLVEVIIALGVMTFCLMPMLGLLLMGIDANHEITRETTATNLAAALSNDLCSTIDTTATTGATTTSPYYGLQVPSTGSPVTNTIYLSADGAPVSATYTGGPVYLAIVKVMPPPASEPLSASAARILIAWPPFPSEGNGTDSARYQNCYQTVIGLPRN